MTTTLTNTDTPFIWSLSVLRPDLSLYLDNNINDMESRLLFTDVLVDNGYELQAERWKWMIGAGRYPNLYKEDYSPYSNNKYGRWVDHTDYWRDYTSRPHAIPKLTCILVNNPHTGCHCTTDTRQHAEDILINFLCTLDTNPFLY